MQHGAGAKGRMRVATRIRSMLPSTWYCVLGISALIRPQDMVCLKLDLNENTVEVRVKYKQAPSIQVRSSRHAARPHERPRRRRAL